MAHQLLHSELGIFESLSSYTTVKLESQCENKQEKEEDEPGMVDWKCYQLENQISPCIGCFLTQCLIFCSPWREALSLSCSKAFTVSILGPNSSRVSFSIPSAVCHGVGFLRTWLLPVCAYLPLSLCPPIASGVGVGHLHCLLHKIPWTQHYVLKAPPQSRTWLWG